MKYEPFLMFPTPLKPVTCNTFFLPNSDYSIFKTLYDKGKICLNWAVENVSLLEDLSALAVGERISGGVLKKQLVEDGEK